MKIVGAIVTYNRKSLLEEALSHMEKFYPNLDLVIVDNASTDGTSIMLEEYQKNHPKVKVVFSKENLGGAGGFNLAIKEAMKASPDGVWIMDDDTMVNETSLSMLEDAFKKHPEGMFFSSKALWIDGTENVMNTHRLLEQEEENKCVLCREATFVSLLINAKAILNHGLPIKEFFIWGDDIEYTRRLSFKGKGYYVPASTVLHKTANNAGSNIAIDDSGRLPRYRYAYRNEVYIAKQEGIVRQVRQVAKILFHTVRVLAISKSDKKKKIALIWSSSKEGLSFNPPIEYLTNTKENL